MITLIIFLLLGLAVIYGIFFLCFKLIWVLLKKHQNKWPLILAGISTFISCVLLAWAIIWSFNKMLAPFIPLQQRIESNPQPQYGISHYTDPVYPISLQCPDGVDFSEWINYFPGLEVKLGINTNVFKKDENGNKIDRPFILCAIVRQTENIDAQHPFGFVEQSLLGKQDPRFKVEEYGPQTVDGMPAYYMQGTVHTNQAELPVWLKAVYKEGTIVYVFATTLLGNATSDQETKNLVDSLKLS